MTTYQLVHATASVNNDGDARYASPVGGVNTSLTEAEEQITLRDSVTWQNLGASFVTVSGSAAEVTARKNSASDTTLQVTSSTANTVVEDLVGTIALASGDEAGWLRQQPAGMHGDSIFIPTIWSEFDASTHTTVPLASEATISVASQGSDEYHTLLGGASSSDVTEARHETTMRRSLTWSDLRLYVSTGTDTGEVTARKNATDDTTLTINPPNTAGVMEDLVGTISLASGDEANWVAKNSDMMDSFDSPHISCVIDSADETIFMRGGLVNVSTTGDDFISLNGRPSTATPTEQNAECTFHTAATLQNIAVYRTSSSGGDVPAKIRKNRTSSTALTVTTTNAGSPGWFEDLVGTESIAADDEACWIAADGTNPSATVTLLALVVEQDVSGGGPEPGIRSLRQLIGHGQGTRD